MPYMSGEFSETTTKKLSYGTMTVVSGEQVIIEVTKNSKVTSIGFMSKLKSDLITLLNEIVSINMTGATLPDDWESNLRWIKRSDNFVINYNFTNVTVETLKGERKRIVLENDDLSPLSDMLTNL